MSWSLRQFISPISIIFLEHLSGQIKALMRHQL